MSSIRIMLAALFVSSCLTVTSYGAAAAVGTWSWSEVATNNDMADFSLVLKEQEGKLAGRIRGELPPPDDFGGSGPVRAATKILDANITNISFDNTTISFDVIQ